MAFFFLNITFLIDVGNKEPFVNMRIGLAMRQCMITEIIEGNPYLNNLQPLTRFSNL